MLAIVSFGAQEVDAYMLRKLPILHIDLKL
jgi:hypothetical protein